MCRPNRDNGSHGFGNKKAKRARSNKEVLEAEKVVLCCFIAAAEHTTRHHLHGYMGWTRQGEGLIPEGCVRTVVCVVGHQPVYYYYQLPT